MSESSCGSKRKRHESNIPKAMRNCWRTTNWVWSHLHNKFNFKVDLAASSENARLPLYLTKEQNALSSQYCWSDMFCTSCGFIWGFGNPPYDDLEPWFQKAARETSREDKRFGVVLLVPAFDGEKRWKKYVFGKARRILVFPDRLRFGHPQTGKEAQQASFASMAIVWAPRQGYDAPVKTKWKVIE